jgi:Pyruvate/2-oxoacid:ferredoxin oxidoreductase delta subunit
MGVVQGKTMSERTYKCKKCTKYGSDFLFTIEQEGYNPKATRCPRCGALVTRADVERLP